MQRIMLLDELTINKIAAGEVVERPASVVKELVENSVDAGASRIIVEIGEGGKNFIRVSDDGSGIAFEDIPIAFQRHGTSKIRCIDDINTLTSNGFRGEALSSISSVSELELMTNTADSGLGKKVCLKDGAIQSIQDIGLKKGTSIFVKSLFGNVPARKKFLKSTTSELIQITDIMSKIAIINSEISFKYVSNQKEIFQTIGDGNMLHAITSVYGRGISKDLIPIEYREPQLEIIGYVSNNSLYQSNRKKENLYVNGRYVKNSPYYYATEALYKELIPIGKYPVFFIHINIKPEHVDPNVHPSKLEVKVSDAVDVSAALKKAIHTALFQSSSHLIPKVNIIKSNNQLNMPKWEEKKNNYSFNPYDSTSVQTEVNIEIVEGSQLNEGSNDYQWQDNQHFNVNHNQLSTERMPEKQQEGIQQDFIESDNHQMNYNNLNLVGIAMDTFILATYLDSLLMIDQHAAHERVLYEKFINELNLNQNKMFENQKLLIAKIVEFSAVECEILLSHKPLFNQLGFEIDDFGFNRIAIRSLPIIFGKEQGLPFFEEVVNLLLLEKRINLNETFKDKLAKLACKSAVKAHQKLSLDEVGLLFNQLNQCENRYTCPHGRPIFIELTKRELEKMFRRIV